jgi:hypothetical protein
MLLELRVREREREGERESGRKSWREREREIKREWKVECEIERDRDKYMVYRVRRESQFKKNRLLVLCFMWPHILCSSLSFEVLRLWASTKYSAKGLEPLFDPIHPN